MARLGVNRPDLVEHYQEKETVKPKIVGWSYGNIPLSEENQAKVENAFKSFEKHVSFTLDDGTLIENAFVANLFFDGTFLITTRKEEFEKFKKETKINYVAL